MILHVDMDAFYAAVEQRDQPELLGRAVIVGGPAAARGVVSAVSYEAREYGVHSAMPTATAERLCPHAVFLPSRMSHYARVSAQIREVFERYTPLVEPLSLDEAFLDVAGSERLFGTASNIGKRIKQEIKDELDLVASVGVAPNKFLAKLASDLEKPDGFVVVDAERIQEFLNPLSVGRLWGVGKVTGRTFGKLGIRSIEHLWRLPVETLRSTFGDHGEHLWRLARGIDARDVVPDRQAKSISHEATFAEDIENDEVLLAWLLELSDQVGRRLRRNQLQGRTVHLKVRFQDFRSVTRALTLRNATDLTQKIYDAARELFEHRIPSDRQPVRLVGVGLSGLGAQRPRQTMLFDEQSYQVQKQADRAADEIRQKFGQYVLSRGSRLLHNTVRRPLPSGTDRDRSKPDD